MMPERAYGTTAVIDGSQRVAPSASAASRWVSRHRQQHLARHRQDVRHNHDREDDARPRASRARRSAPGRAGGSRSVSLEEREDTRPQERDEDEDAPQSVDDAGNRGQQADQKGDRLPDDLRRELGQVDRDAERERHGDDAARGARRRACRRSAERRRNSSATGSQPAGSDEIEPEPIDREPRS